MSFTAKIDADIRGFEQGVDKASQAINKLQSTVESKLTSIGTSFQNIGAKASILSAALVGVGAKAFLMAADFQDALGATEQIFKDSSGVIKDWSDNLSTSYGISKKEALDYANIMGTMLQNIGGMSEEMAGKTAGNLIELAGDLTAMFGGQTSDAVRALTGALKGNNSMLDNYGIAANDAMVKAKALAMGLSDGTGELSLQARQAATLAIIMEQTASAQGQAAREADGASGSMRSFKTEITNLSTELGSVLLPVITPIVSKLRDMAAAFGSLSPETQKMMVIVAGVAAAFAPLMVVIGKVITLLPALKTGFAAVTAAIAGISAPVTAVAAAVVAAVALIITNWDTIKEYFTTGDGAGVFNTIKELATELWNALKLIWNGLVGDIKLIWDEYGKYIITSVALVFDTVVKAVKIPLDIILGLVKSFSRILQGDWAGALDAIKTMTVNVFNGIVQIIKNAVAWATNAVAGLFDFLGMDKVAAKMKAFAASLAPVLQPKPIPIDIAIPNETTTTIKEVKGEIKSIGDAADNTKKSIERMAVSLNDLSTIALPTTPQLTVGQTNPLGGLSMQGYVDKYKQTAESIKEITIDMNQYITDAVVGMSSAVAGALMNGDNVLQAIGSSLLGTLGAVMIDLGKMTILAGSAIEAIKKALTSLSGIGAIAVGAGLIAIGSLFAAGASKLGNSMGSAGGYASSPTMNNTTTPVAPNYRGAYNDNEVVFKIGTNELVGVLKMADNRANRL